MDPQDKVAAISGGASGIGLATARLLGSRGAHLALADLQAEAGAAAVKELEAAGAKAHFVEADVLKRADLQRMLDEATERFGRVDIVYNNAGVSERGDFFSMEPEAWRRVVDIDLTAVIEATQLAVQHLRKQGGGGVIINTASMAGLVPVGASPIYAAAKAGVVHFSRSLVHLAAEDIRVNAICPQYTDTPMVRAGGEAAMEFMRREVGGILTADQIAEGVLQLVEDDTRAGAVMRVTFRKGIDYYFERR